MVTDRGNFSQENCVQNIEGATLTYRLNIEFNRFIICPSLFKCMQTMIGPRLWLVWFIALLSCMLFPLYLDMMVLAKIFNRIKLKGESLDNHRTPQVRGKNGNILNFIEERKVKRV